MCGSYAIETLLPNGIECIRSEYPIIIGLEVLDVKRNTFNVGGFQFSVLG